MGKLISFVGGFILATALCGAGGYYFFVQPSEQRIGQLTADVRRSQEINIRLSDSAIRRQETIDRARAVLASADNSIAKLRNIIKLLQDTSNN
jgi:type II secretory pathway component PulM